MTGVETALLSWIIQYRYFLIIPLTTIEGPLVMLAGGVFVRLGVFDLIPMYFALMAGDLIGDIGWYAVGYHWGRPFVDRFGHYFSIDQKMVAILEGFFQRWRDAILIISKLTMGFGFAGVTLFTAGLTKVPFRRYLLLNVVGEFFWTAFLMSIGYFFTDLYVRINTIFSRVSVIAVALLFFAFVFGVGRYIRAEILKKSSGTTHP
jgi:membrane protein DedA with SNARE-associated domain